MLESGKCYGGSRVWGVEYAVHVCDGWAGHNYKVSGQRRPNCKYLKVRKFERWKFQ